MLNHNGTNKIDRASNSRIRVHLHSLVGQQGILCPLIDRMSEDSIRSADADLEIAEVTSKFSGLDAQSNRLGLNYWLNVLV